MEVFPISRPFLHSLTEKNSPKQETACKVEFRIGDIVKGEVLDRFEDGSYDIRSGEWRINVKTDITLKAGDRLFMRVVKVKPRLIMVPLPCLGMNISDVLEYVRSYRADPAALSRIISRLYSLAGIGHNENIETMTGRESLSSLEALLNVLIFSPGKASPEYFRDFVNLMGYSMEKQLAALSRDLVAPKGAFSKTSHNLKGILLALLKEICPSFETEEDTGGSDLLNTVKSLLSTIESHQVLNTFLQETRNEYRLHFPILLPGGVTDGEIRIRCEDRSREKNRPSKRRVSFSISIKLESAGRVLVESSTLGSFVTCSFKCEDEGFSRFMALRMDELRRSLGSKGYNVSSLVCSKDESFPHEEDLHTILDKVDIHA